MEARTEFDTSTLIIGGEGRTKTDGVLTQNGSRSGNLVTGTLLGLIASTGKFVPADPTDPARSANLAVYIGADITEADIIAGDVSGLDLLVGGDVTIREDLLVLENGALDDASGGGTNTMRQELQRVGIFVQETETLNEYN